MLGAHEELVIEFQRVDLDLEMFEKKRRDYNSININNIWILSGNKEELNKMTREHNLTFFQRLIVNDMNNLGLFLDVENREITMMSKIVYKDEETKEIVIDKIFYKTYQIDKITIHMDGTIDTDFKDMYKTEKLSFIEKYKEIIKTERELQLNRKKNYKISKNEYIESQINNIQGKFKISDERTRSNFTPEERKAYYKTYKITINEILYKNMDDHINILPMICYNNISINEIVEEILCEEIKKGNEKAIKLNDKINETIEYIKLNRR